jgi:hypothetical protein
LLSPSAGYKTLHLEAACSIGMLMPAYHSARRHIIENIIIIIIWHYNPLWGFTFSAKSFQVILSLDLSFQFLTSSFF